MTCGKIAQAKTSDLVTSITQGRKAILIFHLTTNGNQEKKETSKAKWTRLQTITPEGIWRAAREAPGIFFSADYKYAIQARQVPSGRLRAKCLVRDAPFAPSHFLHDAQGARHEKRVQPSLQEF